MRFDRWGSMAFERAALQRSGAMSLPFGAMRRHSLAHPHALPSRYTRRRIAGIAGASGAQLTPLNAMLDDFPDRGCEVLAVRALESIEIVAGPLRLYSNQERCGATFGAARPHNGIGSRGSGECENGSHALSLVICI